MLFTQSELNGCSMVTGKNYWNLFIKCSNSLLSEEYYRIAKSSWNI